MDNQDYPVPGGKSAPALVKYQMFGDGPSSPVYPDLLEHSTAPPNLVSVANLMYI